MVWQVGEVDVLVSTDHKVRQLLQHVLVAGPLVGEAVPASQEKLISSRKGEDEFINE